MDVQEAVKTAKEYVHALFSEEFITNLGLEEVDYDVGRNLWKITIGFSRPWDRKSLFPAALGEEPPERSLKVIRIDDATGEVKSLTSYFPRVPS